MANYKTCDILKTTAHRAKLNGIWGSGKLVTHMWCAFDLVVFKVILVSFGALSQNGL